MLSEISVAWAFPKVESKTYLFSCKKHLFRNFAYAGLSGCTGLTQREEIGVM